MDLTPQSLQPLLRFVADLDLHDPEAARVALDARYPLDSPEVVALREAMEAGVAAGTVCHMGEDPVRYSRLFKATEDSLGFSADAVLMSAPGPRHLHPEGEVDLCFALDGEPKFDGNAPGWTVYGPGSQHVPTVAGGTMLILYLLPQGAIEFLK
jgi:hypothetical protein